ncbi:MAG: flavin reductase family protein [Pararhodobacter sp.]
MVEAETFIPSPSNQRRLRDALGRFATGVTVVTARAGSGAVGITANSFASLSLDPPLVLWAPARASRRFAAFAGAAHFAVHVLGEDQFALGRHFALQGFDFDLAGIESSDEGVPLLPGCLARFECRHEALHEGGDHALVVGRVCRVSFRKGAPLIFSGGRYGGFAPVAGHADNR